VPATPEGNRALLARLEQLLGQYDKVRAQVADAQTRSLAVTGTAASADGGVRVTVDRRGALTGLEIDPRSYRKSSPTELADTILELSARAALDAGRQTAEVLTPFLPRSIPLEDIAAGTAAVSAMPAGPLTDASFDAWWAELGSRADQTVERRA
jgi:DNA-binding protein YbaB